MTELQWYNLFGSLNLLFRYCINFTLLEIYLDSKWKWNHIDFIPDFMICLFSVCHRVITWYFLLVIRKKVIVKRIIIIHINSPSHRWKFLDTSLVVYGLLYIDNPWETKRRICLLFVCTDTNNVRWINKLIMVLDFREMNSIL